MAEKIKERQKCPFYGFAAFSGVFMDQYGNQCPFRGGYSPCYMEYQGKEINWSECQINKNSSRESLQKVLENCRIFPAELMPEGAVEWAGIPLREWYDRIISPKQLSS
jgi:hypothetical protein